MWIIYIHFHVSETNLMLTGWLFRQNMCFSLGLQFRDRSASGFSAGETLPRRLLLPLRTWEFSWFILWSYRLPQYFTLDFLFKIKTCSDYLTIKWYLIPMKINITLVLVDLIFKILMKLITFNYSCQNIVLIDFKSHTQIKRIFLKYHSTFYYLKKERI